MTQSLSQIILDWLFSELGFPKYLLTLDFMLLITNLWFQDFKGQLFQGARSQTDMKPGCHTQEHRVLLPAQPQNQAPFHLSLFLLIAKVRNRFSSQAQKSACFFSFFFITNKTLSSTHRYKCFMLFAYSLPEL